MKAGTHARTHIALTMCEASLICQRSEMERGGSHLKDPMLKHLAKQHVVVRQSRVVVSPKTHMYVFEKHIYVALIYASCNT